jgi:hypothetical protein
MLNDKIWLTWHSVLSLDLDRIKLFVQADSAILALNCSGMVLGSLQVRQGYSLCVCSILLYLLSILCLPFHWLAQGEPFKDTSSPSLAWIQLVWSRRPGQQKFRAAKPLVVALETIVLRISNCRWREFSLVSSRSRGLIADIPWIRETHLYGPWELILTSFLFLR